MIPDPDRKLIRVARPAIRATLTFEPTVPLEGPVVSGPLIHVRRPAIRGTLTFEPVDPAAVELNLPVAADDGPRALDTLRTLVGKVNEIEALFGRAGVRVDDGRSGLREGAAVVVLAPHDPADAVATCKRVADQLFAAVRLVPGVTVRVLAADQPVYVLAP